MHELPRVVEILHHPNNESGTSVFNDGARGHWAGGSCVNRIVVFETPWANWWELENEPKSIYAKILVDPGDPNLFHQRDMSGAEESQWDIGHAIMQQRRTHTHHCP